jgi:uncharacterized protein
MKHLNAIDWLMIVLVIVGGLNLGFVGLFNFDLVAALFGDLSFISRIVYGLVGIAALYLGATAMQLAKK